MYFFLFLSLHLTLYLFICMYPSLHLSVFVCLSLYCLPTFPFSHSLSLPLSFSSSLFLFLSLSLPLSPSLSHPLPLFISTVSELHSEVLFFPLSSLWMTSYVGSRTLKSRGLEKHVLYIFSWNYHLFTK